MFTDNNPLVHLNTARLGAVEQRWVAQLANFKYVIKYRPGTQNKNADALSRLPEPQDPMPSLARRVIVEGEPSWADLQAKDPELVQIRQRKEQGLSTPGG